MDIDLTKTQQYLEWLKEKLYLNYLSATANKKIVCRGEVYRCKFGVGIGSEESKERPCVILQYNSANKTSPNTIVAPISHTTSKLPVVVPLEPKKDSNGKIILDGNVLLGNITCISKARLGAYITTLTSREMNDVDKAVAFSLHLMHHYQSLHCMYQDKLHYIELLKEDLTDARQQLENLHILLSKYQLSDMNALTAHLENTLKNR